MSKILVLAEKPSVGRDIGKVLNCNKKGNGYLEGNKYIVTWALGHLVTIANPGEYDKKYESWKLEELPILPDHLKLVVIKRTSKQYHAVRKQMNRKDVSEIVIATDAGREGELVARWILEKAHINKPLRRLWISSVTDKAIKDGFNNLKDGKDYENLYQSAVARAEADWVVGINATRALTCKYNAQLSCGRVQTPTITMISKREEEINSFIGREYYGITAKTKDFSLTWQDGNSNNNRTFDKNKADKILNEIKGKDGKVIDVHKVDKKTFSPKLYDLTELQRDANRMFDFSAKETLSIMQRLYERHKVLTYPRTDSRYLTSDLVETLKDRIEAINIGEYRKPASVILRNPIRGNKSFVDNSKVGDHHAIIPTEERLLLSKLSNNERKIYDLVAKRFLAVLYPPFEYEQTTIRTEIGRENFVARGKRVLKQGWKEVYGNKYEDGDDLKEEAFPLIKKGDQLKVSSIYQTNGKTQPPPPFNEGTLLSAMENPKRYMSGESKDLIEIVGETGGIGTVATRADVIEKLFNAVLIEKRGKGIFITAKGKQLLDLVPEDLKSPALTGEWEQNLNAIAKGRLKRKTFIDEMKDYSKTIVRDIKNSDKVYRHDNLTRNRCPECDKFMLEIKNKRGTMHVCQDRECGHRISISENTNARCPRCRKKLKLRGEGDAKTFTCSCGHREKLSVFNKRKAKSKSKISKRDAAKYMKKQKKEKDEGINTELADALSQFKVD